MHHFLKREVLGIECNRGIHIIHDIADFPEWPWEVLSPGTYFQCHLQKQLAVSADFFRQG